MSRTRGAARGDLLPVDPNRARIRPPSAKGTFVPLAAATLSVEAFDLFIKNLFGQKPSHLRAGLNQTELRIDRAVEASRSVSAVGVSSSGELCLVMSEFFFSDGFGELSTG